MGLTISIARRPLLLVNLLDAQDRLDLVMFYDQLNRATSPTTTNYVAFNSVPTGIKLSSRHLPLFFVESPPEY